jgi:hypothetical protein
LMFKQDCQITDNGRVKRIKKLLSQNPGVSKQTLLNLT